ncbi:MAG: fumarylacetoacetate hydrolase family protein, partial [Stackebrandtia sp.]
GPPLAVTGKIVCVGLNYADHAAEAGVELPSEPILFLKTADTVIGPDDQVLIPRRSERTDYEGELAVVIGRTARHVAEAEALSHVFGYTCLNDVTARDLQFGDLQWARGKSLDTFCPMGPVLVTPDEIGDPQSLGVRCLLNGEVVQDASTAVMYHSVARVIAYCSRAFTLRPGDVIATGTPGGVGIFRDPPLLLGDGDEVVVEIDKVGRLTNRCRTGSLPATAVSFRERT